MLRTLFVAACFVAAMTNAIHLDEVEGLQQYAQLDDPAYTDSEKKAAKTLGITPAQVREAQAKEAAKKKK